MEYKTVDESYLDLLTFVLQYGDKSSDRTGTGTIRSSIAPPITVDCSKNFPLLSWKKTSITNIFHELMWFIKGRTDLNYLVDRGVNIWNGDAWKHYIKQKEFKYYNRTQFLDAVKEGTYFGLGPIYGAQWSKQLPQAIETIKNNPNSRRIIVNSWNVEQIPVMALPPCHCMFQFIASTEHNYLDIVVTQRSADIGLGVPYNIASYALLLHLVAIETGRQPRYLRINFGDAHIYADHVEPLRAALEQDRPFNYNVQIGIIPQDRLEDYELEHIKLTNYKPNSFIKLPLSN